MKIKFLGTSAGWPLPRLGCRCEICTSKDPKDKRTRTQLLVNDFLLLDVGIDTYQHLAKPDVDPTKIKFAAITHEHGDHTLGFWDLSHIYTSKDKVSVIIHPSTFSKVRNLFFPGKYKILKTEAGSPIKIDGISLTLLPVQHTNSSFGILVSEGGKRLFYAPDMKILPQETFTKLKGVDLLAVDGSELRIKTPNHQTIEEGINLGKKLAAKKIYFVHIGHRILPHEELNKLVKNEGGVQFNTAYDGLEADL